MIAHGHVIMLPIHRQQASEQGCRLAVGEHGAEPRIEPTKLRDGLLGNELGERTEALRCTPLTSAGPPSRAFVVNAPEDGVDSSAAIVMDLAAFAALRTCAAHGAEGLRLGRNELRLNGSQKRLCFLERQSYVLRPVLLPVTMHCDEWLCDA
jgi:hypothetical protein